MCCAQWNGLLSLLWEKKWKFQTGCSQGPPLYSLFCCQCGKTRYSHCPSPGIMSTCKGQIMKCLTVVRALECLPKRLFFLGTDLLCLVCDLNSNISCKYYKIMLAYFRARQACWWMLSNNWNSQRVSSSLVVMWSSPLQDYWSFKWDPTTFLKRVEY